MRAPVDNHQRSCNFTSISPYAESTVRSLAPGAIVRSYCDCDMKPEPPSDYRSSYPTPAQSRALKQFIDGLYDAGIVAIHTGAGALSTPMGEAEIDRLAEAVLTSLRKITTPAVV